MILKAREEMNKYYRKRDLKKDVEFTDDKVIIELSDEEESIEYNKLYNKIYSDMNAFYRENKNASSVLLKSRLHRLMAENCDPVIFLNSPFFFELGYNHTYSWGLGDVTPACWLKHEKRNELTRLHPLFAELENRFLPYFDRKSNYLCGEFKCFDEDHHVLGYTKLFSVGVKGLIKEARENIKKFPENSEGFEFLTAVIESLEALITAAHKFSDKALKLLDSCENEEQRKNLQMIAETAKTIPENPPKTFYEGLAMLIFLREAVAVMENIGVSQFGHMDRLLGDLYDNDIKEGRMTEEEARELVAVWMMHTDIKFNLESNSWPETSTCIQLGGCDASGNIVFNDVTKIIIEEHQKHKLINPKLNCRYSENSPAEYLKLIGRAILSGNNNFALINDKQIISGLVKSGVKECDARLYVNGGCQETMIEGFGHTEGAGLYFSTPRFLDLFLRPDKNAEIVKQIDKAESFEEFYEKFIQELDNVFSILTDQRHLRLSIYKEALSCPMFSATQEECITNGRDYVNGGARYNFSTVALVGLANIADSLVAIKDIVFDKKKLTLSEFNHVLEKNWEGYEELHHEVVQLPKYGHNEPVADAMANRFLQDAVKIVRSKKNERGGNYILSTFVYHYNRVYAPMLRATPDGRRDFEYFASGCGPSLIRRLNDITKPINSMSNIDFTTCGGGVAVFDVMLPMANNFDEEIFASLFYACDKCGCVAIQPNSLSLDELIDAKKNPEKHKNLIVRICGLSAYFTALTPNVQDEIINRNFYEYK